MIKVTVGEIKSIEQVKPFPKIMRCKTHYLFVLFREYGNGTVLLSKIHRDNGNYAKGWNMNNFEDYNEPITLQNEIS